jgi:hypothetical protein
MTDLEKKLWICLMGIANQADEDCPQEYRTRHFDDALFEAQEMLKEMNSLARTLPT